VLTDLLAALVDPAPRHLHQLGPDRLAQFLALPVAEQLQAIEGDLSRLGDDEKAGVVAALGPAIRQPFVPLPGPQTAAFESLADELLFGGSAGSSKSYLLLGVAASQHHRSLIIRRQSTELDGLSSDLIAMLGADGYNKVDKEHTAGGRSIKLGGMQYIDDWRSYAGRPRDFMGFDEAGELLEEQVSSILGWLRSTDPRQRCRAIFASNPPRGAEGQWLIDWFAPWIEPSFPNIARPGELRWFVFVKGKTHWVDGPGQYEIEGESYTARSRTFIPGKLSDNPFLARTEYRSRLENLPEPLRSQLLHGNFLAGREDDAWQVIPSDWIMAARQRWQEQPPSNVPMTSIGVDVAQGGGDQTAIAPRHGSWFAPLKVFDGINTKDGPAVAGLVFTTMRDGCAVAIDLGGGWGGSAYDHLKTQEIAVEGVVPSAASDLHTKDGKIGFVNKRAELWWKFREALDPNDGAYIALPPDPALVADLATPRWKLTPRGVQVELKEEIRKRLGRSPDRGDAVVMAWGYGNARAAERVAHYSTYQNVGYASAKRHLRHGRR
jgi:hypothetical protein